MGYLFHSDSFFRFAQVAWLEKMTTIFLKWWWFHGDESHRDRIRKKTHKKNKHRQFPGDSYKNHQASPSIPEFLGAYFFQDVP